MIDLYAMIPVFFQRVTHKSAMIDSRSLLVVDIILILNDGFRRRTVCKLGIFWGCWSCKLILHIRSFQ